MCRAHGGAATSIDSLAAFGKTYVSTPESTLSANNASSNTRGAQSLAELQGVGGALRMVVAALWVHGCSFKIMLLLP